MNQHRPLIFATPHYGVPLAALVAGSHLLHGKRALNIFYDKARHEAQLRCFFERAGANPTRLLGGQGGVRSALRALARAECVAILPDAFADIATTVVVPFFTRLLRIASGTAFLARRSNALIVPVFAMPAVKFGVRIHLGTPIDPQRLSHEDEAQAIFILSHLLFNRIEEQLRFEPEHWRCWETLPLVSTPLRTQADLNDFRLLRAVESRLYALPPALQDIPELELLLR